MVNMPVGRHNVMKVEHIIWIVRQIGMVVGDSMK